MTTPSSVDETSASKAPEKQEIRSLTGLRALLAWWIVVFHFGRDFVPEGWWMTKGVMSSGYVAVDVFFVLSGFVLMRRYAGTIFEPSSIRHFYLRRWARIYPVYALSLAIGAAASFRKFSDDLTTAEGLTRIGLELLLLNAWSPLAMFLYNFAAWSLSVEAFFYLLCPWLLPFVGRRKGRGLIVLLAVAWLSTFIAPALYTWFDPDHLQRPLILGDEVKWAWYLKFFPVQRLPEFVAGAIAARMTVKARVIGPLAAVGLLAVLGCQIVPYVFLVSGVLLPLVVFLVMGVAASDRGPLCSRVCVVLGEASFATYILHWPLFLLWSRVDRLVWDRPSHVLAFMGVLCAVSLAVFRFVEEPLRRRLTRGASRVNFHRRVPVGPPVSP